MEEGLGLDAEAKRQRLASMKLDQEWEYVAAKYGFPSEVIAEESSPATQRHHELVSSLSLSLSFRRRPLCAKGSFLSVYCPIYLPFHVFNV